jgi:hypothetical protein
MGIVFIVLTFDIRLHIIGLMKEMFKQKKIMWPHMTLNVYKCHNYGYIAHDCRSIMDIYLVKNIDIRYKKVWKRNQEQVKEYQINEGHLEVILSGLAIVRDKEKSIGKKEDVRYRKIWRINGNSELNSEW